MSDDKPIRDLSGSPYKEHREHQATRARRRDLAEIGSFSVLSDADRQTIQEARRWLQFMWQQGMHPTLDALEWDGIFDTIQKLADLNMRTSGEAQLR